MATGINEAAAYSDSKGVTMAPGGGLQRDQSAVALAHSSKLLKQALGIHNTQEQDPQVAPQASPAPTQVPQSKAPQQSQQPEKPEQEVQEAPEQNPELDKKIADLQSTHEREIMMLRHEMEVAGIKDENKKKIDDIEMKHKQEIEDIKQTVKGILNG